MKGLIIKAPWIDLILAGQKIWEIRGSNTTIRGKIYLIQSGTGKIIGTAELMDSIPLQLVDFRKNQDKHCIPSTMNISYKQIYAWVLQNPVRFEIPKPYVHPQGAVIWVNLDELNHVI